MYDRAVFVRAPAEARPFPKRPAKYSDLPTRYRMGAEALLPGIKGPRSEGDCLPPYSSGIENKWIYTPTPPCAFIVRTGITLHFWLIPKDIRIIILSVVLYGCET